MVYIALNIGGLYLKNSAHSRIYLLKVFELFATLSTQTKTNTLNECLFLFNPVWRWRVSKDGGRRAESGSHKFSPENYE